MDDYFTSVIVSSYSLRPFRYKFYFQQVKRLSRLSVRGGVWISNAEVRISC